MMKKPGMMQESSDGVRTSNDVHRYDSENSGDDEPLSPEVTAAPQNWPIIQIVAPPLWLPEGWTAVLRTRESGSKDKYYVDPVSQRRFRSKTEVNYFLQTGKSYRYKRNLALLTKPLKEDPVSLPCSVSLRNMHVDGPGTREESFMSPSVPCGGEHGGTLVGEARSLSSPDLRLSLLPPQAEPLRKPSNKPDPKPKSNTFMEDLGMSSVGSGPRRSGGVDERTTLESSQGQGSTENRGKLILKLKRKSTELDEGERSGRKPRPFEVVGATALMQGKPRSSTSDEEERHTTVDSSSRAPVPQSLFPSSRVSRRPNTKAPLPSLQYQPHHSILSRPQYGGGGSLIVSSNGQGYTQEKNFGSVYLVATELETIGSLPKRKSPAEQLQMLGRKLCQQAVDVLCTMGEVTLYSR